MIKKLIRQALIDLEQERKAFLEKPFIDRDAGHTLLHHRDAAQAKVISGLRRSGKSVVSHLTLKDTNYAYVNFDDERLTTLKTEELNYVIETLHSLNPNFTYLLLDEIQNIERWELFVNKLLRNNYNIFITGSNAKLLSKELATHLTGRCLRFELFPFSFHEYLKYNNVRIPTSLSTKDKGHIINELYNYFSKGGLPETYTHSDSTQYLKDLYEMILLRDTVERNHIRNIKTLREVAFFLMSNYSNRISYNKIKKMFTIKSIHTVKNYVSYLEDAYLIFQVFPFSWKVKEQLMQPKKIYAIDTAMLKAIGVNTNSVGHIMENIVAIEFFRTVGKEKIWCYYDHQQYEVDFLIAQGEKKKLIQVTYASSRNDIKTREITSLLKASEKIQTNDLTIITWDYEATEEVESKQIEFIPMWKWLLKEKSEFY